MTDRRTQGRKLDSKSGRAHSFPSSLPLPSSISLPLPLISTPLIAARGSGERSSSPSGSGQSPAAKRVLAHLGVNLSLFECLRMKHLLYGKVTI